MTIVVVGGSASNVGKTTLAVRLIRHHARRGRTVAVKVSVREGPCDTTVLTLRPSDDAEHRRDTGKLLAAGAECVVWVTVSRPVVRAGLARGLAAARRLAPATIVFESTSAGIELRRIDDSWFVAGEGAWKPWAERHRRRADHVVAGAGGGEVQRQVSAHQASTRPAIASRTARVRSSTSAGSPLNEDGSGNPQCSRAPRAGTIGHASALASSHTVTT